MGARPLRSRPAPLPGDRLLVLMSSGDGADVVGGGGGGGGVGGGGGGGGGGAVGASGAGGSARSTTVHPSARPAVLVTGAPPSSSRALKALFMRSLALPALSNSEMSSARGNKTIFFSDGRSSAQMVRRTVDP
jgi:hypothetical protein